MGIFGNVSKDNDASPGSLPYASATGLEPLTHERILENLQAKGYQVTVDEDGDIGGNWDGRIFYFFQYGEQKEILQIRGRWDRDVHASRMVEMLQHSNDWNRDRIWPKVYARIDAGGDIGLYAEVSVDLEHGVTDDQLSQIVACGLGTGSQFFDHLDATLGTDDAADDDE